LELTLEQAVEKKSERSEVNEAKRAAGPPD